MIIEQTGAQYYHNETPWVIGAKIVVTGGDYEGLNGILLSIRDGDDMETENTSPDFYCALQPPSLPADLTKFEKRMSQLYGEDKHVEDVPLDLVILSPSDLEPVIKPRPIVTLYIVKEEWACEDGSGSEEYLFTDLRLAKACMNDLISEEKEKGCIVGWRNHPHLIEEADETSFECYIDGYYCESHYTVELTNMPLELSNEAFKTIGEGYVSSQNDNIKADPALLCIKSNGVFSPQNYLYAVTGNCYTFSLAKPIRMQIEAFLKYHGLSAESFSLKESPLALRCGAPMVLVDCSDCPDNDKVDPQPAEALRWFHVPDNFTEDDWC